jgi:hypothetical protein
MVNPQAKEATEVKVQDQNNVDLIYGESPGQRSHGSQNARSKQC